MTWRKPLSVMPIDSLSTLSDSLAAPAPTWLSILCCAHPWRMPKHACKQSQRLSVQITPTPVAAQQICHREVSTDLSLSSGPFKTAFAYVQEIMPSCAWAHSPVRTRRSASRPSSTPRSALRPQPLTAARARARRLRRLTTPARARLAASQLPPRPGTADSRSVCLQVLTVHGSSLLPSLAPLQECSGT